MTKSEIIMVLLVLMVIALALELAYIMMRRRHRKGEEMFRKQKEPGESMADRAHNMILTTESISATLARQGVNTGEADILLRQARKMRDARDYAGAIERAESAKIVLLRARRRQDTAARPDRFRAPALPRQAVDISGLPEPDDDEQPGGGEEVDITTLPPNYIQAKFMLATLKDNMDKKGVTGGEAFSKYQEAVGLFDGKNYSKALSVAVRAEQMLATGTVALIGEAGEGEEEYPDEEVVEVFVCPQCDAEVSEDDAFCGNCGYRLVVERECLACGEPAAPEDRFCRKCGHKLE